VSFFDPHQVAPRRIRSTWTCSTSCPRGLVVGSRLTSAFSAGISPRTISRFQQVPDSLVGPGDTQALRPFPQFSNVTLNQSVNRQVQLPWWIWRVEKRFSRGFSMLCDYTKSVS